MGGHACGCVGVQLTWCASCVEQQNKTISGLTKFVMEQRRQIGVMGLVTAVYAWRELQLESLCFELLSEKF